MTDWGLAWDLGRSDDDEFTGGGTPCYMSPEMARHYLCQTDAKKLKSKLSWLKDNDNDKTVSEIKEMQQDLEQLRRDEGKYRKQINEQSDVYVLGAILFHIAVGYPPHLFLIMKKNDQNLEANSVASKPAKNWKWLPSERLPATKLVRWKIRSLEMH